jgi:hypothetical protein
MKRNVMLLSVVLTTIAYLANAGDPVDELDTVKKHITNNLTPDSLRKAVESVSATPLVPNATNAQVTGRWSDIDLKAIPRWADTDLQQIVNTESPAPAVNKDSPNGVSTASCDSASLKHSESEASKFALSQGGDLGSVALIERRSPGEVAFSPIATAFSVSSGWIATNYHVVATFTDGRFPQSHIKQGIEVAVLFTSDPSNAASGQLIPVPATTTIFGSPDPDVVVFHLQGATNIGSPQQPSAAGDQLDTNEEVAIVGFPQRTGDDSTATYQLVFGLCADPNPPLSMRIAIGTVASLTPTLSYAINTLASNSGSPIFRVSDGLLVGMHSGFGSNPLLNNGVPVSKVDAVLAEASSAH